MRIRTRHKIFNVLIVLGVVIFAVSLVDMFMLDAEYQFPILASYILLIVIALLLYIGHKPVLGTEEPIVAEEIAATPAEEPLPPPVEVQEEAVEVVEVPKQHRTVSVDVAGPHYFRCPFCSNLFALEATHRSRTSDFRINCAYCGNSIRIPRKPKVAPGKLKGLRSAAPTERALYSCANCGEVLRITAPRSAIERALNVSTCPNCRSRQVVPATAA